jgi:hypothetical protein
VSQDSANYFHGFKGVFISTRIFNLGNYNQRCGAEVTSFCLLELELGSQQIYYIFLFAIKAIGKGSEPERHNFSHSGAGGRAREEAGGGSGDRPKVEPEMEPEEDPEIEPEVEP